MIDPITLEIVCEGLISVVREMRASIIRASFSPVIYELDDFSCALFNAKAEMVAQSDDHPGHVLPMPWTVKFAIEDLDSKLVPGDIVLLNDSYRGGTHLNDVTLIHPIFEEDELALLIVVRTHWEDVGGMTPGSYSGLATNIFQEGLRLPALKLFEGGKVNDAVMKIIRSNMRLPERRMGDLDAMIGTCKVAEKRLRKLFLKYGFSLVVNCIAANLDRCEKRIRGRIRGLPDGKYVHEDYLEYYDDGRFDPVLMRLALEVCGDEIVADFDGSNQQVPGVVNSSLAVAGAGVFVALKSTLDPGGAVNEGVFRPIKLKAPEASIVDVRNDAPAGAHGEVRKRAVSVALGCLSQIVPDQVSGDLCGTSFPNSIGGWDSKRARPYVYYEVPAGGNGGFREADGSSAYVNVDFGNIRSIHNVETLENDMPVLVERCRLRTNSGGAGNKRGGLGMQRELRFLDDEAIYSVLSDRAVIPPFGISGGTNGYPVCVSIESGGRVKSLDVPGKATGYIIRKGDLVVMESAGGGGYGDPLSRPTLEVARDNMANYVSSDHAKSVYGVCIDEKGEVDEVKTGHLRSDLRSLGIRLLVIESENSPYEGIKGRHRTISISRAFAQKNDLADGQLAELIGKNPAPLRGWVKLVDADIGEDFSTELDDFGRRSLGVDPGDQVLFRLLPTLVKPGSRFLAS